MGRRAHVAKLQRDMDWNQRRLQGVQQAVDVACNRGLSIAHSLAQ